MKDEAANISTRLPWRLTAAALIAFVALYFTAERFIGLPILGLLLLISQLITFRLPPSGISGWTLRIAAILAAVMLVGLPEQEFRGWYHKDEYTNLIGVILAAELVIRSWQRVEAPLIRQSCGIALFLSTAVMAMAGVTYDRGRLEILAPIFVVLILLTLRSFARIDQPALPRRRSVLMLLRAAALCCVLGLGLLIVQSVTRFDRELTRLATDLLRQQQNTRRSAIGLSVSPRLTAVFNPGGSMDRVLLIEGPRTERHLRTAAFDGYSNGVWGPALHDRTFFTVGPSELQIDGATTAGSNLKVRVLGDTADLLPLPLNTSIVRSDSMLERDPSGAVRLRESPNEFRYEAIVSSDGKLQGPLCLKIDEAQRQRLLQIPPEIDPGVAGLTQRIVSGEPDPASRVFRIAQYLQSNHSYSLSYDPRSAEPLSDFVLNRRSAHCQYFASAVVIMSRAVGVPARFVGGYYAHEGYGDGRMVVRGRDAHAWAECWIDGVGWITIDATPAGGTPDALFGPPSRLRRAWEWAQDFPATLRAWLSKLKQPPVLVGIALAAIAMLAISTIRARRMTAAGERPYAAPGAELLAVARRFEKWLLRRGTPCAANRTWREHATRNIDCLEFINVYDEARFGHRNGPQIARLHELLEQFEKER